MISDPDHRIHAGFGPGSWNAQLRPRLAAARPNALPVLARFLTASQPGASPRAGPAVSPQEESAGPFTELAPEPDFRRRSGRGQIPGAVLGSARFPGPSWFGQMPREFGRI